MLPAIHWRVAFVVIATATLLRLTLPHFTGRSDADDSSDLSNTDHDISERPTDFDSPKDFNFTKVTSPKLHRRIDNVLPMDNDRLSEYVTRGRCIFQPMLMADIAEADRLITIQAGPDPREKNWQRGGHNDPKIDSSWTSSSDSDTANARDSLEPISIALGALPVGRAGSTSPWAQPRQVSTGLFPNGPNMRVKWNQDKHYRAKYSPNKVRDPTGAEYWSIYNIVDGTIVIQSAWGPAYMAARNGEDLTPDELPKVSQWSDVTYIEWAKLHQTPADYQLPPLVSKQTLRQHMKPWLNWIVVQSIVQPQETLEIIARCLHSRDFYQLGWPFWGAHQTFASGHWCFFALLATKNNYGIAWLLIQHKADSTLGHKVLKSVTIFSGTYTNAAGTHNVDYPSLIWEVVDYDAEVALDAFMEEAVWEQYPGNNPYLNVYNSPIVPTGYTYTGFTPWLHAINPQAVPGAGAAPPP